jgi:hypothetical protein
MVLAGRRADGRERRVRAGVERHVARRGYAVVAGGDRAEAVAVLGDVRRRRHLPEGRVAHETRLVAQEQPEVDGLVGAVVGDRAEGQQREHAHRRR